MAAIGDGWEDGAWVEASWAIGAWFKAALAAAGTRRQRQIKSLTRSRRRRR